MPNRSSHLGNPGLAEPSQPYVLAPIDARRQAGDNFIKSQAMIIKNQGLVIAPARRDLNNSMRFDGAAFKPFASFAVGGSQ
jgi:hypothetical protein